jgi:putative membrane protein
MSYLERIIMKFIVAMITLVLATKFVSGVQFTGPLEIFLFCGLVLALINAFIRPFLKKVFFLLRLITFGLFDFIMDMGIVWFLDIFFPELNIVGLKPLFFTTLILVIINFFFPVSNS